MRGQEEPLPSAAMSARVEHSALPSLLDPFCMLEGKVIECHEQVVECHEQLEVYKLKWSSSKVSKPAVTSQMHGGPLRDS